MNYAFQSKGRYFPGQFGSAVSVLAQVPKGTTGLIWSRAQTWVAGSQGHVGEAINQCVYLTLMFLFPSPFLPFSSKINGGNILR